jgi:serine protease Do
MFLFTPELVMFRGSRSAQPKAPKRAVPICLGALLLFVWGAATAVAQPALPAAIERPGQLAPETRADLYRQLNTQAEFLEKQSAVLKTISKLLCPSVVHIEADVTRRPSLNVNGKSRRVEENGSGVIIQLAGKFYVLTNRHVLTGARPSGIKINLCDGSRIFPEKVWEDADTDVAVMSLRATDLSPAVVGNSDKMEIGDFVLALGCPFGLAHSVTFGVISGKGRRNLELGEAGIRLQDFLQTDAAINPGNSGGPLVNLRGEVIGLNTCIASSSGGNEGVAFSIPSNMVMNVARQLVETGRVRRSYMGVTLDSDYGPATATELGLPRAVGALVSQIAEKSPAATAQIRERDVILLYNDVPIEDDGHLMNLVSTTPAGKVVPVVVFRDGQTLTVKVTVVERGQ